ncbi:MAG: phosphate ABC transporter permease subunit PstC [Candidatus Dormibacteria bacterium]
MSSVPVAAPAAPTPRRRGRGVGDRVYVRGLQIVAALFVALLVVFVLSLVLQSKDAFQHFGFGFITGQTWDPVHGQFGALSFIAGTLATSAIALVLALPIGLGTAIFLAEFSPRLVRGAISALVELLAAVPSVVYGLWGLLAVAPWVRDVLEPALKRVPGLSALTSGPPIGIGLLLAGIILAAMILPTIAAVSRDVLAAVPLEQKEAALALGGTRWQMVRHAMLPAVRTGILGAVTLGLGRALGETIAVTMVIGNTNGLPHSLLQPSQTIASVIANEFTEATEPYHLTSLVALGLVLLLIGVLVNAAARLLVWSVGRDRLAVDAL